MGIVFNKRGGVGMGTTRPEPVPLPFLRLVGHLYLVRYLRIPI